ncbi:MAG TPA: methylated-DNA--[protein]-cysteine S-methyltransferase [Desulfurivibrionaceae bacterium]|nr:methylated-DNA--[protein]-cysteine S-methyltransferase [Desulfurivibrionaceae bacterium]
MTDTIHYAFKDTALGLVAMGATPDGISLVEFGDDQPALLAKLRSEFPEAALKPATDTGYPLLGTWLDALAQFLDSGAELPELPLDIRGSDFECRVWQSLRTIPQGDVWGYRQLAESIGQPSAVRAVASACGRNRIGVLIPCHRVLRGDGQLGGYRWGLSRKQALLRAETARKSGRGPGAF